jgi:hypothetical protein
MYHKWRSMCLFSGNGMTSLQREDLYIIANYGKRSLAWHGSNGLAYLAKMAVLLNI